MTKLTFHFYFRVLDENTISKWLFCQLFNALYHPHAHTNLHTLPSWLASILIYFGYFSLNCCKTFDCKKKNKNHLIHLQLKLQASIIKSIQIKLKAHFLFKWNLSVGARDCDKKSEWNKLESVGESKKIAAYNNKMGTWRHKINQFNYGITWHLWKKFTV